jgi:hypothetical protein
VWKSIVSKTRVLKAGTLVAVLGLAMVPYSARAAPGGGSDTVQGLYDALLSSDEEWPDAREKRAFYAA